MRKLINRFLSDLRGMLTDENELFSKIFVILLIILIVIGNILMGCELNLNTVWQTCKRPIAPAIGVLTQFFIMPILAYSIAKALLNKENERPFALGLFVTGCAPSGIASNFWTILFDGNANLSVTMTFISTIFAFGMMPFWMNLLGYHFLKSYESPVVHVPYDKIMASLLALVIPLLIGIGISRCNPNLAARARKILRPFVIFVLTFVIIFGTILNLHIFGYLSWSKFLSGLLLPLLGFTCGCFSAIIFQQHPSDVAAIAIETGIQNTGIAIMLLKISFPGPEGDLNSLLPIIVACTTPIPLLMCYCIHKLVRHKKNYQKTVADPNEKNVMITLEERNDS